MSEIKRKHIRFSPDPNTFVGLKIGDNEPLGGLAISESQGGCSAVFLASERLKDEGHCLIKVGELPPFEAEIKWVMKVDKDLVKLGFEYLT